MNTYMEPTKSGKNLYVCQVSAWLVHTFVIYGQKCEVCEIKMIKKKKLECVAHISELVGAICYKCGV